MSTLAGNLLSKFFGSQIHGDVGEISHYHSFLYALTLNIRYIIFHFHINHVYFCNRRL